jgi:hypothetical protein
MVSAYGATGSCQPGEADIFLCHHNSNKTMPALSANERAGRSIERKLFKTIDEAYACSSDDDEDLPLEETPVEQTPLEETPVEEAPPMEKPVKAKRPRQRKKVIAVVEPSAERTEVVLSRPKKRKQVIVYNDAVDEPLEIVHRHRKPGRPASQPKPLYEPAPVGPEVAPPPRLSARDVKQCELRQQMEELEVLHKRKLAKRKDGSVDGRSLAKRSDAQMESARKLVERNRAARLARAGESAKAIADATARATIDALAKRPAAPDAARLPTPPPTPPPTPTAPTPTRRPASFFMT